MSLPNLLPASTSSKSILPETGSHGNVNRTLPYKVYSDNNSVLFSGNFVSGAVDQVAYTYKKLGGDVLDIELSDGNIYAAYEEAVLEYSYLINIHQANNALPSFLGHTTGTFDHKGELTSGPVSASLKYPRFDYGFARNVSERMGAEIGLKDSVQYSASFDTVRGQQDYDLQDIISSATNVPYAGKINGKRILVKKVFYKTPQAMWRFYGYYGGLNVVGNFHNYGQFSDDSSFQLVPTWQNKSQALAFEDAIYTRMSHYSYEIRNNKLRLFPIPYSQGPKTMWVEFSVPSGPIDEEGVNGRSPVNGINNMNTLPFSNLPYDTINSIGKQWIRRFALALAKEMLGLVRSKFGSIPIPGESVTLNGSDLVSQGKEEQNNLREELKTTLAEMTYAKMAEQDAAMVESSERVLQRIPYSVYVG
tara:strand:- start:134 stop:1390 length:1257 start_codon:yes stop_codon:yes gene_type:complete